MAIIKQSIIFASIFYIISRNLFLVSNARPIDDLDGNNDRLDMPELAIDPFESMSDDPLNAPGLKVDPLLSSPPRFPDISGLPRLPTLPLAKLAGQKGVTTQSSALYRGQGDSSNNGKGNKWWYEIGTNGNLRTSPKFFEDQSVSPELKKQVQSISDDLKKGGHG
ncbi:hypothetical protein RND81_07G156900 [Saponaria officinalis]|uniref:Uncharacterized protein n=1 Tax=Saponaria officinalis TaxID=3572 RepID=A0AAW1JS82_SAPOF